MKRSIKYFLFLIPYFIFSHGFLKYDPFENDFSSIEKLHPFTCVDLLVTGNGESYSSSYLDSLTRESYGDLSTNNNSATQIDYYSHNNQDTHLYNLQDYNTPSFPRSHNYDAPSSYYTESEFPNNDHQTYINISGEITIYYYDYEPVYHSSSVNDLPEKNNHCSDDTYALTSYSPSVEYSHNSTPYKNIFDYDRGSIFDDIVRENSWNSRECSLNNTSDASPSYILASQHISLKEAAHLMAVDEKLLEQYCRLYSPLPTIFEQLPTQLQEALKNKCVYSPYIQWFKTIHSSALLKNQLKGAYSGLHNINGQIITFTMKQHDIQRSELPGLYNAEYETNKRLLNDFFEKRNNILYTIHYLTSLIPEREEKERQVKEEYAHRNAIYAAAVQEKEEERIQRIEVQKKKTEENCKKQKAYWSQEKRKFPLAVPLKKQQQKLQKITRSNHKILHQKQEHLYEQEIKQQVESQKTYLTAASPFSSSFPRSRLEAIRFTVHNPDVFEMRSYDLETQNAHDILAECGIDPIIFKNNRVNALQNEINYEVVDIITQAGDLRFSRSEESIHHLMHASVHGGIAAKSCSTIGQFVKSFKILDWCSSLIQWVRERPVVAAAEGIIRGGINLAALQAVTNICGPWAPVGLFTGKLVYDNFLQGPERRTQITHTAHTFFKFLSEFIPPDREWYYKFGLIKEYEREKQHFKVHWQTFLHNLDTYKETLLAHWNSLPTHEKIRNTTQYITELFPKQVFGALSSFSKALKAEEKIIRTALVDKTELATKTPATSLMFELNELTGVYELAKESPITEKVFEIIGKNTAIMGPLAAEGAQGAHKFISNIKDALSISQSLRTTTQQCPVALYWMQELATQSLQGEQFLQKAAPVLDAIMALKNEKIEAGLKDFYSADYEKNAEELYKKLSDHDRSLVSLEQFKKVNTVKTKHIFKPDLYIEQNGKPFLKGYHHDYQELLNKSNLISLKNRRELEGGFYEGIPVFMGIAKDQKSTFFPAHWDEQQIINKIKETLQNASEVSFDFYKKKIIYYLQENPLIKIKVVKDLKGNIETAYPTIHGK